MKPVTIAEVKAVELALDWTIAEKGDYALLTHVNNGGSIAIELATGIVAVMSTQNPSSKELEDTMDERAPAWDYEDSLELSLARAESHALSNHLESGIYHFNQNVFALLEQIENGAIALVMCFDTYSYSRPKLVGYAVLETLEQLETFERLHTLEVSNTIADFSTEDYLNTSRLQVMTGKNATAWKVVYDATRNTPWINPRIDSMPSNFPDFTEVKCPQCGFKHSLIWNPGETGTMLREAHHAWYLHGLDHSECEGILRTYSF